MSYNHTNKGVDKSRSFFYTVNNGTIGTGIAINADPQTIAATEGCIVLINKEARGSANGNTMIVPEYIKIHQTVLGTGSDGLMFEIKTDSKDRWTSGGTSLTTLAVVQYVDTNSGFTRPTTAAEIHVGDLTLNAESSAFVVGRPIMRTTIGATGFAGDVYIVNFGNDKSQVNSPETTVAVAQKIVDTCVAPVLGPGCSMVVHPIMIGATAAAEWEIEIAWQELHKDANV